MREKPKNENPQETPVIDRALQIAMMKFFLRTSTPRILKNKENNKP